MDGNLENKPEAKMRKENKVEVATGAFIIRDGKLFLATGPKFHDQWVVPGGHLNFQESSKDCIEREVKEEIGVDVEATVMFAVIEDTNRVIAGRTHHFVFINWKCKILKGEPKLDGIEFTKMTWMPLEQVLTDSHVAESVKASLRKMK